MTAALARRSHRDAADSFLARAVAIFVLAMAAQSAGGVLAQTPGLPSWWSFTIGTAIAVSGCWIAISGFRGRNPRPALTIFAGATVCGLALWPIAHPTPEAGPPWIWNLLGLSVACVAAAWGQGPALVYGGVTSVLLAAVRVLPGGGSAGWLSALEDAAFLLMAGLALTAAIQAVRVGAERADASAAAAMEAYQVSAVARARLIERNRLDAILHDWVLTALVSAARSQTPQERRAAAELAAGSLERIAADGRSGSPHATPLGQLPDRLQSVADAGAQIPVVIHARLPPEDSLEISGEATEALLAAVHAAVDNASRHSGTEQIAVALSIDPGSGRLRIEIEDRGRGFDPAAVSSRCLGIRLSIIQRMLDIGGSAVVESWPGRGTRVRLECEARA